MQGSIVDANARALVLGLFRNVDPTGPAAALDAPLGGAIREFAFRRMFDGSWARSTCCRPRARRCSRSSSVFAGLGDFDEFGPDALAYAAENVLRTFARSRVEDFATVLIGAGSGSTWPPPEASCAATSPACGARIRRVVRRITICEVDGASSRAACKAMTPPGAPAVGAEEFEMVLDEDGPRHPPGGPRRARGRPGASIPCTCSSTWTRTGATPRLPRVAPDRGLEGRGALSRYRSRRRRPSQIARSRDRLAPRELTRSGERLARTLLAASVREGLAGMAAHALVVVHDREASRVPWEVMRIDSGWPALEQGMSRRYASENLTVARWREAHSR